MKINLCLILVSTLLAMNSNAQDITTESVAILDSIRNTDTKVKILYVTQPKEEPKPKEFYSVQLGAYIAAITSSQFANAKNVYQRYKLANRYFLFFKKRSTKKTFKERKGVVFLVKNK